MLKTENASRSYCIHYTPSNIDCPLCRSTEKDYANRPLYAPLYVPLTQLSKVLDESQLKLPHSFYVPFGEKHNQTMSNGPSSEGPIDIATTGGTVRVPRSALIQASGLTGSSTPLAQSGRDSGACQPHSTFSGDFQKHAHRFTRSFSWKTKPEASPFAHMQPLPKLIQKPGYTEMCCKSQTSHALNSRALMDV
jgi:hypothetical protein